MLPTSRGLIDHKSHMCRCNQRIICRYNYIKPAGGFTLPTSRGLIDHKTHMCRCNQRIIIRYNYTKPAGGYYCMKPAGGSIRFII